MKRGFTLIELLAVIVILAIVALISTPVILNVIDEATKGAFKDAAYGIVEAGELGYTEDVLNGTVEEITYTYTNGTETSEPNGRILNYRGTKPQNGTVIVNTSGKVALAIHNGSTCAQKGFAENEVFLSNKTVDECIITGDGNIIGGDNGGSQTEDVIVGNFNQTKGVNIPKLTSGMTPIIWNETTQTWDTTTVDNPEWYDYTEKKWANVKTADGSFWVWIPRYAYQIATNYHTDTPGIINVKFLIDNTNTATDATTIENTPLYSGNSQTNYITHPAFTFDATELTGIWVAKFEPTAAEGVATTGTSCNTGDNVSTKTVKVIPNVSSWRCINLSNAYTVSLNMKNNTSIYGWNSTEIDTHLIKSIEWGSVAYLAQSSYGKGIEDMLLSTSDDFITGCAGTHISEGCDTYETANGVKGSTTGTIYGVYDMSGGALEFSMSNYNNISSYSGITDVASIPDKYIDRYSGENNGYNTTIIGDAVYETSFDADIDWVGDGMGAWYDDYSFIFSTEDPSTWYFRGGHGVGGGTDAGIFSFMRTDGLPIYTASFRPIVIVN